MTFDDPYFKLRPPTPTPADELCSCAGNAPIKLMSALSYNPIHCIDCNREVPPELLSLEATLAEDIARWRSVYHALDHLWLDSGDYELWAKAELENVSSPINQRGLDVASQLNTVRRCYYWLFQDQSIPHFTALRTCPICSREFDLYAGGVLQQAICDHCSVVTVWS